MAWTDVPAKLQEYDRAEYAKDHAAETLLLNFGVTTLDAVPEHMREEFEEKLDHSLGACRELAKARAWRGGKP